MHHSVLRCTGGYTGADVQTPNLAAWWRCCNKVCYLSNYWKDFGCWGQGIFEMGETQTSSISCACQQDSGTTQERLRSLGGQGSSSLPGNCAQLFYLFWVHALEGTVCFFLERKGQRVGLAQPTWWQCPHLKIGLGATDPWISCHLGIWV